MEEAKQCGGDHKKKKKKNNFMKTAERKGCCPQKTKYPN